MSRCGEDNEQYYDIKIKASELLLQNVAHTFVTPVFNGSTSLRDASGQLIENTVKSVRRNETIDDAYFEELYSDMISLHRLDQLAGLRDTASSEKADLGKLPQTSVILLLSLAGAWMMIICFLIVRMVKKKREL